MKIKITNKEQELEGKIMAGVVKPSGTSAHIPFSKQHIAKKVSVIVSTEPFYSWILSDAELNKFILEAKKVIEKEGGKLAFYKLEKLERIRKSKFKIEDMERICEILKENNKLLPLTKKIEKLYNLN